jgi:hypothetical protein
MKTYTLHIVLALVCASFTSCTSPTKLAANLWEGMNPWAHGTGQVLQQNAPVIHQHLSDTRHAINDCW